MSVLPKALSYALSRFETGSKDLLKIVPLQKTQFGNSETILFRLPTSGVVDLYSLCLIAGVTFGGTAVTGDTGNNNICLGDFFSKVEVRVNGATVWGASCTDFAQAYRIKRQLAEPGYVNASSNRLFDMPLLSSIVPSQANFLMMSDFPWTPQCRYLPLAALGEVEIALTINTQSVPLTGAGTGALTLSGTFMEPYILIPRVSIPGEASPDQLVARYMSMGRPLELAYQNWTTTTGNSIVADGIFPISVACQSLDYLTVGFKASGQTGVTYANSLAPISSTANTFSTYAASTVQLSINGVPTSSSPLSFIDAWYKMLESLDGLTTNLLVDPQVSAITGTATGVPSWLSRRYLYVERFTMPVEGDENRHLVSGLSTYGAQLPMQVTVRGATGNTYIPFACMYHTSTLEISPGRMTNFVN